MAEHRRTEQFSGFGAHRGRRYDRHGEPDYGGRLGRTENQHPLHESDGKIGGTINIEVPSTAVVDMVAANLMRIKGVEKAYRVTQQ